jgi:hypothetical protein
MRGSRLIKLQSTTSNFRAGLQAGKKNRKQEKASKK